MKKFLDIGLFRSTVGDVKSQCDFVGFEPDGVSPIYAHTKPYPVIKFTGTVKIHGTNAAIVKYKDRTEFQSRDRVLSLDKDNCGFMLTMAGKNLDSLFDGILFEEYVAIYGEWCGGSVQKGVAVAQLPKMFVIFSAKVDGKWIEYKRHQNADRIYNIFQFPTYEMDVDFNKPQAYEEKLAALTEFVEKECPVGKHFGVSGVGEGIVWTGTYEGNTYTFKVKGKEHSVVKTEKVASAGVEEVAGLNEFVEYAVTENRLKQGISVLKSRGTPINVKATGLFVRWVQDDVVKEETDTLVKNQIDWKKVSSLVATKARDFFMKNLEC